MKLRHLVLSAFAALLVCSTSFAQPISDYYLTAGDQSTLTIGSGAGFTQMPLSNFEYPIAVNGTVRTTGPSSGAGTEYDLAGNPIGTTSAHSAGGSIWDGTTDGTFNYAYNFGLGGVYRFNSDWSGGTLQFASGGSGQFLGITYDPTNDSVWISGWSSNLVENRDMSGNLLSSFNATRFNSSLTGLGLDHADGTLWMGSQQERGVFAQYDKSGNLLSEHNYGFNDNVLGGEFDFRAIPEPSSAVLLGVAVFGLAFRRRRKA